MFFFSLVMVLLTLCNSSGFIRPTPLSTHVKVPPRSLQQKFQQSSSPPFSFPLSATQTFTLDKPLGLILEEITPTKGAFVASVNAEGSAYNNVDPDSILKDINDIDVRETSFDDIMTMLINSPSPVKVTFMSSKDVANDNSNSNSNSNNNDFVYKYEVGELVDISVQGPDASKIKVFEAKVGDKLRDVLLLNKVEVYRGMKQKLGNCGGNGQCTFCRVKLQDIESSYSPKSEFEIKKIGGTEEDRLACFTLVDGPATVTLS